MTTVFRGGGVFDGHRHLTGHAVVVEGDRVTAVVPERDAPSGDVVDLAGGLVAPGFVDAHVHAVQGGLERLRCDLSGVVDRDQCLAAVASYAASHDDPWVLGGGWSMQTFEGGTPTAALLDAVVPDRPAFLLNRDHHGAWVNSRALALAGIDSATPDPPHGRIERDPDGRPTGTLHEAAMALVGDQAPGATGDDLDAALAEGQRYLHSLGVTGWQDAILGDYAGMRDPSAAYRRAADSGALTADVVGALWWDRDRGAEQVADLVERRERLTGGRLRATAVKIMADGVAENFTAAMSEPYLDRCGHATANRGHAFVDSDALVEAVTACEAAGFQVHVHAIGDRAVRDALDAFAAARERRTSRMRALDLRHHIAHIQVIHPDDRARFADLGVAANMQALWACADVQMVDLTLPHLGPERSRWQYPFADLHRLGARLVAGSDWPVSTPDPLAALHVAVNRAAYGDQQAPFLPEQALDLATAWAAYTSGSAWINHRADAGVLGPGAAADLVVLDRDPFTGPVEEIGAASVQVTVAGGRIIHEA